MFLVDAHARTGEGGMVVHGCLGISVHVVMSKCMIVLQIYCMPLTIMSSLFAGSTFL